MLLSQKCQYALRAVFEIAKRSGEGPIKIEAIAKAQAIPPRFLAVILNQLKQGGFVQSRRGSDGGYFMGHSPSTISVGEIIRFVEGPIGPVECITDGATSDCPLYGACAFMSLWQEVQTAMTNVYDKTTIKDLLDREIRSSQNNQEFSMYFI